MQQNWKSTERNQITMLDEFQKKALTNGHILIIAGAGSGKTTTIIEYMKWLIDKRITNPNNILYLSFTNKAANEGAKRSGNNISCSTIHSFCYHEITNYLGKNIKVASRDIVKSVTKMIDNKVTLEDIEGYQLGYGYSSSTEDIENTINYIHKSNYILFSDMLLQYKKIIWKDDYRAPDFTHICVDEANDLCSIQYELISNLAMKLNATLVLVGDYRQSIYGFRGANPDVIDKFVLEFNPNKIYLNKGYRCRKNILNLANKIASGMKYHQDMISDKNGGNVLSYKYPPPTIAKIVRNNKVGTIAYLARTNLECSKANSYLKKNGIPTVYISDSNITNTKYGRTIRSILASSLYRDKLSLAIMFKRIKVGVGPKTLDKYPTIELLSDISVKKQNRKLEALLNIINNIHEDTIVTSILDEVNKIVNDERNISTWIKKEFDGVTARDFLEYLDTISNTMETDDINESKYPIRIGTIHSAKGLEFDHIVLDLSWFVSKYPDGMSPTSEEQRVLYVGVTRAKESLNVTRIDNQDYWLVKQKR